LAKKKTTAKKIAKKTVRRMELPTAKPLREKWLKDPAFRKRLKEDVVGTLEAEGIKVDDALKERVLGEWRAGMEADIRKFVAKNPKKSKDWYLRRVVEGKPLMINVKIDRKTGRITKTLGGDS
jgi:hypothetical protein